MGNPQRVPLLLITGTVGVGKSSVADAVFEILKAQSKPIALINLDELGYAYPKPEDDLYQLRLRLKNLAAIQSNYIEAGVKAFIIPYVLENRRMVELFRKAVPGADIFVVRLNAPLSVLEERIRNRPMGGEEEWHVKRAAELTAVFEKVKIEDSIIDTENKTIPQVAQEVIGRWNNLII